MRWFQLAVKIREEVGKSFCSKGYKIIIKLGILDLVNDPSLLELDIKQSVLKKYLIWFLLGSMTLMLYFVISLSCQVLYQSVPTLQIVVKFSSAPFTWCKNYRTRCRDFVVKKRNEEEWTTLCQNRFFACHLLTLGLNFSVELINSFFQILSIYSCEPTNICIKHVTGKNGLYFIYHVEDKACLVKIYSWSFDVMIFIPHSKPYSELVSRVASTV